MSDIKLKRAYESAIFSLKLPVINIIRTIILLITFIKIVLTRNFLAHAVTFGDLMTGNFLAGDFLGGYQIAHIWLVKLMISVQHGWMLEIF